MTYSHNILHGIVPYGLPQLDFDLSDRGKTQHGFVFLMALCTLGVHAQGGQAGIRAIDQLQGVQVSNHSPIPQYAVSAQHKMLFLVLDQQFNRPTTQVVHNHLSYRSGKIARHQMQSPSYPRAGTRRRLGPRRACSSIQRAGPHESYASTATSKETPLA